MSEDKVIVLVATGIADLIVGGGGAFGAVVLGFGLHRAVARMTATLPDPRVVEPSWRWAAYALSVLQWPAALGFTIWFLTRPETARAALVCYWILVAWLALSTVLAIAIVTAGAWFLPPGLLPL